MSAHNNPGKGPLSAPDIRNCKGARKVAVLTAYDCSSAALADAAGVDAVLVGDSLGMVMLGRPDTLSVTLDEMILHCRSVKDSVNRALVVADMPFMSYEPGVDEALRNAARLCRMSGVRAVKLEGGKRILPQVEALIAAGIPVMGHLGLTPQRAAVLGGFKVQGKTARAAAALLDDALSLQEAGCFSLVLEAIPAPLARRVTERLSIPTIGIGAGPDCDGQVLVYHDLLGLYERFTPRFVKQYAKLAPVIKEAVGAYVADVRAGTFPGPEHSFGMPEEEKAKLDDLLAQSAR